MVLWVPTDKPEVESEQLYSFDFRLFVVRTVVVSGTPWRFNMDAQS